MRRSMNTGNTIRWLRIVAHNAVRKTYLAMTSSGVFGGLCGLAGGVNSRSQYPATIVINGVPNDHPDVSPMDRPTRNRMNEPTI